MSADAVDRSSNSLSIRSASGHKQSEPGRCHNQSKYDLELRKATIMKLCFTAQMNSNPAKMC